jgi:uncharacterized protein
MHPLADRRASRTIGAMRNLRLTVAGLMVCVSLTVAVAGQGPGKAVLEPFDYHGVALEDGPLLRQVLEVREFYLRIPDDDLLKGFRKRAGLAAPGNDLGGWYSDDIFHVFGQIVSGLSRMYAATGDEACREKVHHLVSEWGKCIAPDGYFFYSDHTNAPHYVYEKTVCGLVDAARYAGNRQAIGYLGRITDWAVKNLDRTNKYGFNWGGGPTEWYTLSENLYRAYLHTGDEKYRSFAKVWEYTEYWDIYAKKGDIFSRQKTYHAYSHVNCLSGAGAAYEVTGETHYLDTLRNAYDYLQANQTYATGGYGPNEQLAPAGLLLEYLDTQENHFETQCGSWAGFKMCKYLMRFTGDARYGDWIERLIINGLNAATNMGSDGRIMYYSCYGLPGATKHWFPFRWPCCAGSYPQATADYEDLVYFKDADSLYVNLFTPSHVDWKQAGAKIRLEQSTRFPESPRTVLTMGCDRDVEFALKIRVPGWLAGEMQVNVNGETAKPGVGSLHWVELRRTWRDGDRVEIELPMRFEACRHPASSKSAFPAAICYGPVTLAFRSPDGNPVGKIDFTDLGSALTPSPGEPLTFHLAADPSVLVRPFYMFRQDEPYYIYFDPARAWSRTSHEHLQYSGEWTVPGFLHVTRTPGSTVEFAFEGVGFRWVGQKFDDAGKCEVSVDGKAVAQVDQYAPERGAAFSYVVRDLPSGRHAVRLKLLEEKNPASKDRYANIGAFDVLAATAASRPAE